MICREGVVADAGIARVMSGPRKVLRNHLRLVVVRSVHHEHGVQT